jgi:hypothetical protein
VRRDYERVHQRFSTLESFIQRSASHATRERMLISPDRRSDGEFVTIEVGTAPLRQLLPIASKGLCCIDIYLAFGKSRVAPRLRAALFVADAVEPEAEWLVPAPERTDRQGRWYSLGLDRSLDGIPATAGLVLSVDGPRDASVHVAVGGIVSNEAYCARDAASASPIADRPIAMRLWEAPPGLLTPRAGNLTLSEPRRSGAAPGGRLPAISLQQVRELRHESWQPDFRPVSYLAGDEAISVHPPDQGACGAVLDQVIPRGALSVSATAFIAHEASNPVEFAMAVVEPSKGAHVGPDLQPDMKGVVAWSGWRSVTSQERHQLTVLLGPSHDLESDNASLIMLTRMEKSAPNFFAWARFADVTIEAA